MIGGDVTRWLQKFKRVRASSGLSINCCEMSFGRDRHMAMHDLVGQADLGLLPAHLQALPTQLTVMSVGLLRNSAEFLHSPHTKRAALRWTISKSQI